VPKQGKGMELVLTYFPSKEMEGLTPKCVKERERFACKKLKYLCNVLMSFSTH